MNKITEYTITSGSTSEELQERVNTLIKTGFQPYGPLCAINAGARNIFSQPMVKFLLEPSIPVTTMAPDLSANA